MTASVVAVRHCAAAWSEDAKRRPRDEMAPDGDIDAEERGRDIVADWSAQPRGACAKIEILGDLSGEGIVTLTS